MLHLANFPYKDGSYGTPTEMKAKFNGKLLSTNEELFLRVSLTDTFYLLGGLQEEVKKSKLNDYGDAFVFLAIDEEDLVFRVVFCGLNATNFSCETLFNKVLILPGQEYSIGYGRVTSLQVQDGKILVILPSRIFEFDLEDIKNNSTNYGYSRSMKYLQYFNKEWFGISTGDVLFILKHDDSLDKTLIETRLFKNSKNHNYDKLVSTGDYLLGKYDDEDGRAGLSIFYFIDEDFFDSDIHLESSSIDHGQCTPL